MENIFYKNFLRLIKEHGEIRKNYKGEKEMRIKNDYTFCEEILNVLKILDFEQYEMLFNSLKEVEEVEEGV